MATLNDQKVFKQCVTGGGFPHLPNPARLTTPLLNLLKPFYLIPMAFNNNENTNLHDSSSTGSGSKRRSFLDVVLIKNPDDSNGPVHHRGVVGRSDHVGSSRNLQAEPSSSRREYRPLYDNYLWHRQNHRPAISQSAQPDHPAAMNHARSFTSPVELGQWDPICSEHASSKNSM